MNESGTRLISQYSVNKAFDRGEGGSRNLPKIIDLKCLEPFIDNDLRGRETNLIQLEDMKCFGQPIDSHFVDINKMVESGVALVLTQELMLIPILPTLAKS